MDTWRSVVRKGEVNTYQRNALMYETIWKVTAISKPLASQDTQSLPASPLLSIFKIIFIEYMDA